MQKKRHLPTLCLGLAVFIAAPGASALGWGRAPQTAVLGQSLDFNVTLRLDPGDVIEAKCVTAEVTSGDSRLPPNAVRVGTDTSAPDALQIRVITGPALDEPVASVTVAVGCPARLSRRFVLLLDPPSNAPSALPPASVVAEAPPPRVVAAPVAPPSAARAPSVAAPAAAEGPGLAASAPVARKPPPVRKAAAPAPAAKPAPAAARLQLDPIEPAIAKAPSSAASAIDEALQAVAQAASAARSAASAASSAESRLAALEQEMAKLRSDAKLNSELAARMKERASAAEASSRWLTPLIVVAALLAALAAWLALRLRDAQQAKQRAWRAAAAASSASQRPDIATSQLPMVTSEIMAPPTTHPGHATGLASAAPAMAVMRAAPPAPTPEPPPTAVERTDVLPVGSAADAGSPRDVSIEELLDLEQQAEFFIVLGQEEAAIDLLVDHLRDTGGGSPLPYLKLLEIYRRRNDREAYERTRARFNHRFNAYAPDWETDLQSGRSLDDYPGVVPRLQQVWPRPLDAMAELEALLFRKSRGQLFDLPAYREVLFLYSLARDLLDRESADSGNVDLLLPLADGSDFGSTSPHPYLALERESVFDSLPEDKPTAPIDLDLSQPDTQPPIVDPMPPRRG